MDVGLKPSCKCAANTHPMFERVNMKGEEFSSLKKNIKKKCQGHHNYIIYPREGNGSLIAKLPDCLSTLIYSFIPPTSVPEHCYMPGTVPGTQDKKMGKLHSSPQGTLTLAEEDDSKEIQ